MKKIAAASLATLTLLAGSATAADLSGTRKVVLANDAGERVVVGQLELAAQGDGRYRFALKMDDKLEEYFLAMRPFRCLTGPQQRLCHFPVEREAPLIGPGDLVPLEYALMFMRTAPKSLHVNPFNGVYYRMRMTSTGITGELHELDMDPFITPDAVPVERRQRPVRDRDLSPGDPSSHWLPRLIVE